MDDQRAQIKKATRRDKCRSFTKGFHSEKKKKRKKKRKAGLFPALTAVGRSSEPSPTSNDQDEEFNSLLLWSRIDTSAHCCTKYPVLRLATRDIGTCLYLEEITDQDLPRKEQERERERYFYFFLKFRARQALYA